jgi:hypothetical protein
MGWYGYHELRQDFAFFSAGAGSDKAKLGRWTWACYRGKNKVMLWCVTIYHPHNSPGALTVAAQHRQYFQSRNDDRDPLAAFLEDFEVELQEWLYQGDHVIVGGDINDDVSHPWHGGSLHQTWTS